ncbi:2'-5' RNA ligase family protein [Actinokineospora sp. HUAS TT18]|uniref:2'-5' RNA ligase family protein n=1 Tax=Actinokineospora sp. HUAS TT18 TaxID=3447451 RepID=UPI003F51FBFF
MSAFPAELPSDLEDPYVIQEHDWQAYRAVDRMSNHWDRPGWTPGRRSYHWMLTFEDADDVRHLAKQCQSRIDSPVFDPVPLDALHLTMGRLAFTDQADRSEVDEVAEVARQRCQSLAAFDLTVGPLAGSRGALRFSVSPWTQVLALHRELANATNQVLGARATADTNYFRPHLSIAYANTEVPVPMLMPMFHELRGLAVVETSVSSVALVELRRDARAYRFDVLAVIALS